MTNLYLIDENSDAIDFSTVNVTEVDGIDMSDYPKFCDAYISEAEINGVQATEEQLEKINENGEFLLDAVYDWIY